MLVCMTRLHPLCSAHQHLFTGRCPAVCPVHLYPHTDSFERGVEAMRMVPRLLAGLKTTLHLERVPTLLPLCMMCTQAGFPADEMNRASLAASDQIQIGDQSRCFGLAAMQSSCTVSRSEMGCLTLQSSTVRPAPNCMFGCSRISKLVDSSVLCDCARRLPMVRPAHQVPPLIVHE